MNHHFYRVVFNPVRAICIAVPETAARGCARRSRSALAGCAASALALLLAASAATAQIIPDATAPGHQRPTVLNSANGTPTVNIQTPSAAGVSRNRYQQFDIGQHGERGAILNNSRSATASQIGGWVPANPWLAKGGARVIVNEVQSAAPSRLSGALEVAGRRADVIVANPSGLVVNGLSLLNAAGLTLAGGQPQYRADGSLEAFRVQNGSIRIEGQGLDAARTDYAQILAQAITLNAGLWAQDLRVSTGANHMPAEGMLAPNHSADPGPEPPEPPQFALDVAHLGGMYAGKISIVGTQAGFGVRNAGMLMASSGPLTLSVNGQLRNAGVMASQGPDADLQISAKGIDNSGMLSSQRDSLLSDGNSQTANTGTLIARRQLVVQAGPMTNLGAGTLSAERLDITGTRLDNTGRIHQTGAQALEITSLAVSNSGAGAVLGAPPAGDPAALVADGTPHAAEAVGPAGRVPPLPAGKIHMAQRIGNTGQLLASGSTDVRAIHSFANHAAANLGHLHAESLIDNRDGTLQAQRITGAQELLNNSGGSLSVATELRLVNRHLENTGGFLGSAQSLLIDAQTVINDAGTLSAGKDLALQAQSLESSRKARLVSQAGSMRLTIAGALNNRQAQIVADQGLLITSDKLNNAGGTIQTTGARSPLRIQSAQAIDNSGGGSIHSSGDAQLLAGTATIHNAAGSVIAQDDLLIQSSGLVDNSQGYLHAGQQLSVRDANAAAGTALDQATQTLANPGGTLFAGKLLSIENRGLTGTGRLQSQGAVQLAVAGDHTHQGSLAANGAVQAKALGRFINQGAIQGGQNAELTGREIENQSGAEISAQHHTTLRATQALTNRGLIDGADTRIDADSVNNIGTGRLYGDHVSIAARRLENRPEPGVDKTPVIAARQRLDLGVPVIINGMGATLQSLGDMRFGESLDAERKAIGQGSELRNEGALIDAQGEIKLDTREIANLNADLEIAPMAEVVTHPRENMIALLHREPDSATNYRQVWPHTFVPYSANAGGFTELKGIPGSYSDGRMYKPVHPDEFLTTLPAAFIVSKTPNKKGDDFPEDVRLQLEPAGSPRFAEYRIQLPVNYLDTEPLPWNFGAIANESGDIEWSLKSDKKGYEAALTQYKESIEAAKKLNEAIQSVIKNNNLIHDSSREYIAISNATETIQRDKVMKSKPGRIEAGGDIHISGLLKNIDSVFTAGGKIHGSTPNVQARRGNQKKTINGTGKLHNWEETRRFGEGQKLLISREAPYQYIALTTFDLPTVVFREYHSRTPATPLAANSNSGDPVQRPTPVVRQHATESGQLARTLEAGTTLPQSSMFAINAAADLRPLVEIDPAFSRGQHWTSSHQLLDALDPALMQKRLGDGFYEQQLMQQQIGQLTGRRFLGDYRSNDAQYQALLHNAETFAKAHGLRPGVALSAAQMAKLTSDMVWLVEQNVALPDGSVQTVLAPRVYVVARAGDLDARGSLVSADQVVFKTDVDAYNSGTIAGRRLVSIQAHDINNVAGNIAGQTVGLEAMRDINVEGASISATETLLAHAGRDINAATTTRSTPDGRNTGIDQVAAFALLQNQAQPQASGMHLSAGRDINLQAAKLLNQMEDSETSVVAGRNVNLATVTTVHHMGMAWDPKNHLLLDSAREVGTEIYTRGLTTILASNDLISRAAQVQSTRHLGVAAAGSVSIEAGQATSALDSAFFTRRSGFLGASSSTSTHKTQATESLASNFSGQTVRIDAGKDIDIAGSNVHSELATVLKAGRDISLLASPETSSQQSFQQSQRSGLFGSGGLGVTIGSQRQSTEQSMQRAASAPSTVGSLLGPVFIEAGKAYRQVGSNTWALQDDVTVLAKRIAITGSPETESGSSHSRSRQSGLTLAISSPVIGMAQTASSLADAASNTSSTRMQALAAGAAALNIHAQRKALQGLAGGRNPGARLELSLGSSKSQSDSAYSISGMRQSQVLAGGNVNLIATGAGKDSDLLIQDTNVYAGEVATLHAEHKIRMLSTPQTRSATGTNSSRSTGFGVSMGAAGPALSASASRGQGHSQSEDLINSQTQVGAGEKVAIFSGGDTQIRDAIISAPRITGAIGGNLLLESVQDTSRFDGRQSNSSISGGIGVDSVSASAGYSDSRAHGDFASVSRRSGIYAGDGGFDVHVKGNTGFKGGVIASTQAAIDQGLNRLITATVTHGDIENRSDFEASGINLSGGFTTGGKPQGKATGSDTVSDPARWSMQNQGRAGVSAAAAGVSRDSGSERSLTRSSISPGQILITNEAAQQALTGQSAAEAVASINRDVRTGEESQGLTRNWDGQKLLQEQAANAQIRAAFGQAASQVIGEYARQQLDHAADLRWQAQQDPSRAGEFNTQAQEIEKNWGSDGIRRLEAHSVIGGLTGGFQGALGVVSGTLIAPIVANALQENGIPAPLAYALTAVASTTAGALAGNDPGASTALNEVAGNYLLTWHVNILKNCLNGTNCHDEESKQNLLRKVEEISRQFDQKMIEYCDRNPTGDNCKDAVSAATKYVAMQEAWHSMRTDVSRSSRNLLNISTTIQNQARDFSPDILTLYTGGLISMVQATFMKEILGQVLNGTGRRNSPIARR